VKSEELEPTFTLPKLCVPGDKAREGESPVMERPSAVVPMVPPKEQVRVRVVVSEVARSSSRPILLPQVHELLLSHERVLWVELSARRPMD
jgi:hypothetical protein